MEYRLLMESAVLLTFPLLLSQFICAFVKSPFTGMNLSQFRFNLINKMSV